MYKSISYIYTYIYKYIYIDIYIICNMMIYIDCICSLPDPPLPLTALISSSAVLKFNSRCHFMITYCTYTIQVYILCIWHTIFIYMMISMCLCVYDTMFMIKAIVEFQTSNLHCIQLNRLSIFVMP